MKSLKSALAATEVLLVIPAALFMTALVIRSLQPLQYEPAHTAQKIVDWYAARPHLGLWVLMILLPLTVLVSGAMTLLRSWRADADLRDAAFRFVGAIRAHLAMFSITLATVVSAAILAIVALHMLSS